MDLDQGRRETNSFGLSLLDFEAKIAALTPPQQVNAALRRHTDPAKRAVVVAGDLNELVQPR